MRKPKRCPFAFSFYLLHDVSIFQFWSSSSVIVETSIILTPKLWSLHLLKLLCTTAVYLFMRYSSKWRGYVFPLSEIQTAKQVLSVYLLQCMGLDRDLLSWHLKLSTCHHLHLLLNRWLSDPNYYYSKYMVCTFIFYLVFLGSKHCTEEGREVTSKMYQSFCVMFSIYFQCR